MYPSHFKYFGEYIRILVTLLCPILTIKLGFSMKITGIFAVYYYLKSTY